MQYAMMAVFLFKEEPPSRNPSFSTLPADGILFSWIRANPGK